MRSPLAAGDREQPPCWTSLGPRSALHNCTQRLEPPGKPSVHYMRTGHWLTASALSLPPLGYPAANCSLITLAAPSDCETMSSAVSG